MKFLVVIRIINEKTGKVISSAHHSYLSENEMNEMKKRIQYIFDTDYVSNSNETYGASATITRYGDKKEIYSGNWSNRSATEKDIWLKRNMEVLNELAS